MKKTILSALSILVLSAHTMTAQVKLQPFRHRTAIYTLSKMHTTQCHDVMRPNMEL